MKKLLAFFLCLFSLSFLFLFPTRAAGKSFSWYCVHVKNHAQPRADAALSFVENHGGFYIDHNHTDPNADDKVIYLTFDVGYENGNVAKVLDAMKEEGVTGAFFVLGHVIEENADLVRRMTDEGHLVCNHTVHHKDMSGADEETFLSELHALEALYRERIGGEMAHYYRPPEGRFSQNNMENAEKNGYKTIFWSFAYPDWDNQKQMDAERAKSIILDNIHNGEVMLLHPTSSTNAEILGDVIRTLKADGWRFGTLDELTAEAS